MLTTILIHDQYDPHLAHGDVEGGLRLPEARGNVHAVDVAVVGKLEMMMVVVVVIDLDYQGNNDSDVALGLIYTGCCLHL